VIKEGEHLKVFCQEAEIDAIKKFKKQKMLRENYNIKKMNKNRFR
jgi:hypothetical protein